MAGHSKWANIKRKKGAIDAKRGKLFTKLVREIQVAARMGGVDPDGNPRLRDAIAAAKSNSLPKDTLERAIKRGGGTTDGADYVEVAYEGYGPGGVALLIEGLTDNRNRTVSEVRSIISKKGGNLGESGSVAWMFEKKGLVMVPKTQVDEEKLMELTLDHGAEDIEDEQDFWNIYTDPVNLGAVRDIVEGAGLNIETAELTHIPKNTIKLTGEDAEKLIELVEALEDLDDVQRVSANFDIEDAEMDRLSG